MSIFVFKILSLTYKVLQNNQHVYLCNLLTIQPTSNTHSSTVFTQHCFSTSSLQLGGHFSEGVLATTTLVTSQDILAIKPTALATASFLHNNMYMALSCLCGSKRAFPFH